VVARQHDHDRVGARKVLGLALRAVASPPSVYRARPGAAVRTKAVSGVPVQYGLCLSDRGKVIGSDEPLHRNRTQIGHMKFLARLQRIG
jgi:hypothetical protein